MALSDEEVRLCQDFVVKLAIEAGRVISSAFYQERKTFVEKTSHDDLVTETDAAVEKFVISAISKKYPEHRFIGEEGTESQKTSNKQHLQLTDEPTWMIDPIDGTMNFVHSYPDICLSIGLVVQQKPVLGVIYNPIKNELYSARVGGGAYRNGKPIYVSQATDLSHSILATEFGFGLHLMTKYDSTAKIVPNMHAMRTTGSTALNMVMVALGAADCNYEFGLHCWDMAAATVIVREAGGVVMDTTGCDLDLLSRRVLCAASPELARQLGAKIDSKAFNIPVD